MSIIQFIHIPCLTSTVLKLYPAVDMIMIDQSDVNNSVNKSECSNLASEYEICLEISHTAFDFLYSVVYYQFLDFSVSFQFTFLISQKLKRFK